MLLPRLEEELDVGGTIGCATDTAELALGLAAVPNLTSLRLCANRMGFGPAVSALSMSHTRLRSLHLDTGQLSADLSIEHLAALPSPEKLVLHNMHYTFRTGAGTPTLQKYRKR